MNNLNFKNEVYIDFDKKVLIDDFEFCSEDQKKYYKKYKTESLEIEYKDNNFYIFPEDIFYLYNNFFLKLYKKIYFKNQFHFDLVKKELYKITCEIEDDNLLIIKELKLLDDIDQQYMVTQEITVPKKIFLTELYTSIDSFNHFYKKNHEVDLDYLKKDFDWAERVINKLEDE